MTLYHALVYYSNSFWTIYMTSNQSYIIKVYHTSKQDDLKVQVYHTSKRDDLKVQVYHTSKRDDLKVQATFTHGHGQNLEDTV